LAVIKANEIKKQVNTLFRVYFGVVLEGSEKLVRRERQVDRVLCKKYS